MHVHVHGPAGEAERFVAFEHFPWFREATIAQLLNVGLQSEQHLYWPDLDIDLSIESIDHPEKFPLMSRSAPPHPRQ